MFTKLIYKIVDVIPPIRILQVALVSLVGNIAFNISRGAWSEVVSDAVVFVILVIEMLYSATEGES